jgi:hypothetical protein
LTCSDGGTHFLTGVIKLIRTFCGGFGLRGLVWSLLFVAAGICSGQVNTGLNVKAFILFLAGEVLMRECSGIKRQITVLGDDLITPLYW